MKPPPDVIIIRGAPGSGKSELGKALAKHYPQGARVEVDALRKMVISVNWTDQAEHIKLLGLAAGTTAEFVRLGFRPVIVIDTFSGNKVDGFLARLREISPELDVRLFALHLPEEVLSIRLAQRPDGLFKDITVARKLNEDVVKIHPAGEMRLDSSRFSSEILGEQIVGSFR